MKFLYSLIYVIFSFFTITTVLADTNLTVCLKNRDGSVFTHTENATAQPWSTNPSEQLQGSIIPDNGCISIQSSDNLKTLQIFVYGQNTEQCDGGTCVIQSTSPPANVHEDVMTLLPNVQKYDVFMY